MRAHHDQHFLIDPNAVSRIAGIAEVKGRRVLEVGPGNGALTEALLGNGAIVHAVELDGHLCDDLADRFSEDIVSGRLVVQHGDATKCTIPPFELVVANLPYSVSSQITFRLLDIGFEAAVLMYQAEFAERMVTPAGTGIADGSQSWCRHTQPCRSVSNFPRIVSRRNRRCIRWW